MTHLCEWPGCPTMTPRPLCRYHVRKDARRALARRYKADQRRRKALDKARELLRTVTPIGAA